MTSSCPPPRHPALTPPCFVGIDLGTYGCRALAIDEAGKELAAASVTLPAGRRSPEGGSEQDPDDWWEAILSVAARHGERSEGG